MIPNGYLADNFSGLCLGMFAFLCTLETVDWFGSKERVMIRRMTSLHLRKSIS